MVKIFTAYGKLDYRAVGAVVRCYSEKRDAHIGKRHSNIGDKSDSRLSDYAYLRLKLAAVIHRALPAGVDPAVYICGILKTRDNVRAVLLMDRNTVALRDEADDGITWKRVTALGELDGKTVDTVDDNSAV